MRLVTGIPKLDELLDGGIEQNKSVLIYSEPGVEDLIFAEQAIYNQLKKGAKAIYCVNNKSPNSMRNIFEEDDFGISVQEKKNKFYFLDAYSALLSQNTEEQFSINDPTNLKKFTKEIENTFKKKKNGNTIFIFDSLSSIMDMINDEKLILEYVLKWLKLAKKYNVTSVFLFVEWAYKKSLINKMRKIFDCIIDLKAVEKKVILRTYFTVSKANWIRNPEQAEIPFKVVRPGGIKVFIPKLLVTGPYHSGKTSFIHSISTRAVSVNRLGTTVALDHGHVDYRGFAVDVWGTPGQERFDPLLELLGGEALGVIIVIDATRPQDFKRAKEMVALSNLEGLPTIVVANKSNLPGAVNINEIKKKMNMPDNILIVQVVAENLKDVKEGEPCKLKQQDVQNVLDKLFEVIV